MQEYSTTPSYIAERVSRLNGESAFAILSKAKALEEKGIDVIHLEIGQPDFQTPSNIMEAADKAMAQGYTGYGPTLGYNELRKTVAEYAKKYKIGVVLTSFTKGNKQPQNSAFVINKSGDILMKYSKVHTCDFADERNVESGKEFKVCDFEGIQLGIMICYDREYPESARILMLKGAEVILVPNDCGSMQPRVRALSTRAYENMVAVAMANPNGDNAGCSCAFNPICWDRNGNCVDNTVLLADDKTEGILYAEFDMEAIREYRNREMLGNTFRKVEAYSQLLSKEIKKPFIRDGQNR